MIDDFRNFDMTRIHYSIKIRNVDYAILPAIRTFKSSLPSIGWLSDKTQSYLTSTPLNFIQWLFIFIAYFLNFHICS